MYRNSLLLGLASIAMLIIVLVYESACYQIIKAIITCQIMDTQ
jgi:hypothetical protein